MVQEMLRRSCKLDTPQSVIIVDWLERVGRVLPALYRSSVKVMTG